MEASIKHLWVTALCFISGFDAIIGSTLNAVGEQIWQKPPLQECKPVSKKQWTVKETLIPVLEAFIDGSTRIAKVWKGY